MKKSLLLFCLMGISTSLMAAPSANNLQLVDGAIPKYELWCLNHMVGKDTCPSSQSYTATESTSIILYVNRLIEGTTLLADPMHVVCNNTPAIIQRGASYICRLPAGGKLSWHGEPGYIVNGMEGGFVRVE